MRFLPAAMNKHPFTQAMVEATKQAIRTTGVTKTQIAAATGNGNAWVTKLLDGSLRTIREDAMHAIEKILGINYFSVERHAGTRSNLASKIAALVDTDPAFAKLAVTMEEALAEVRSEQCSAGLPWFSAKELEKIGGEVTRIVNQWDDASGKYYPKVGVEVVKLLAKLAEQHGKRAAKKATKIK